jgi:hypothetical protein
MKGVSRLGVAFVAASAILVGATGVASASTDVLHGNAAHSMRVKGVHGPAFASTTSNLYSHGGAVETVPGVYIVQWGWTSDPSGEGPYQQSFFSGVGGSSWINSTTQYCQNVPSGTYFCNTQPSPAYVTNPSGQLKGTWADNSNPLPSHISQTALAQEATRAAAHFGNTSAASNASVQYIIDTPTGQSTRGFGTRFCAWHSSTSSSYGNIAYTNFPYQTDAGASCGQNFVNAGSAGLLDGVSIVGGHEYGETISDQFPSSGWLDSGGAENGDKCAWISSGQGAATNITLSTGTFAVQSLWSNAFNSGAGGCVNSYP